MAKKRSMNIFEAHVEKLVIVLALAVFGWVFVTRFVSSPGVEVGQETISASDAAKLAARKATEIVESLSTPDTRPLPEVELFADNLFTQVKAFEGSGIPLSPPHKGTADLPEDIRYYSMPGIAALENVKINMDQVVAAVPSEVELGESQLDPDNVEWVDKDISLITISAVFPIKELYENFEKCFGPGVNKKPLELYDPVVALVELQRRRLNPDSSWSEYETVPRLEVDAVKDIELSLANINELSQTAFELLIKDRQNYNTQLEIMQPFPYDISGETDWTDPVEAEETAGETTRRPSAAAARSPVRRDFGSRSRTRTRTRGRTSSRRSGAAMPGGMPLGMGMPPGLEGGFGGPPTGRPSMSRRRPTYSRRGGPPTERDNLPPEFKQDKIHIWAIDGKTQPGAIYSYRLRVGFFNPIAGHNWFRSKEDQGKYKHQRVIWASSADLEQVVRVPRSTLFFPKTSIGAVADASVSVEVYRRQSGLWRKRTFRVASGSEIGAVVNEPLNPVKSRGRRTAIDENAETIEVDYRTGVTVIDIVPKSSHWYIKPNMIRELTCADIIYCDYDGRIKRLGTHKYTWPEYFIDTKSKIDREIKAKEKESTSRSTPGGRLPGGNIF
jgi:hypothetical protein